MISAPLAASQPSGSELFAARGVELRRGASVLRLDARVAGSGLVCLHEAAPLVRATWDEGLLARGEIFLLGETPRELLTSGRAGYAPRELPGGDALRVDEALFLGARLIGRGQADVREALERVGAAGLGRRRLGELSELERRRVGLAHGILGAPGVLLLEDLFEGLDELDQELVGALLDELLDGRSFVAALTSDCPRARRLAARADRALLARDQHAAVVLPASVPTLGYWVFTAEPADALAAALHEAGARVTRGPRPEVLWVGGAAGLAIVDAAARTSTPLRELTPAGWGKGSPACY